MKYLLDTNACIEHLRRGFQSSISKRLLSAAAGEVGLCSVVKAELIFGAYLSRDPAAGLHRIAAFVSPLASLPFDDAAADRYGEIRAHLQRQGTPIGPNDLLIAAIALANNVALVSSNVGEFSRVPGLRCEDWSQPLSP